MFDQPSAPVPFPAPCTSRRRAATAVLSLLLAGAAAGQPAPAIEEIVVHGDYRARTLAELPESAHVVDAAGIARRSASHLEQVLNLAANVSFASGASRARYVQIRGIGERGQFAEPLNPSVGLLIDGVDLSGLGGAATLFDVEQVEILRGPQGTRFGANALAGLVNVRTMLPTRDAGGSVHVEAADHGGRSVGVAGGGPLLADRLLYRVAAQRNVADGFIHNDFLGRDDTSGIDETTLRGRLRLLGEGGTTADLALGQVDADNGYDAFSLDNDRHTLSDAPGHDRQRSRYAAVDIALAGTPAVRADIEASIARSHVAYGYDEDWTFPGFHPDGYASTDDYRRDLGSASLEARLLSNPGGRLFGGTTDWVAGVHAIAQDADLARLYTFLAAPFTSEYANRRLAAFGQVDASIAAATTLSMGARVERRSADYDDSDGSRFRPRETLWGANASASHALGETATAYVAFARGFKEGGFNTDGTLDADLREFDAERLLSLELGVKGGNAAGTLGYRVAAFRMWRDDVQILSSITRVRGDGSAEFIAFVGNAAKGTNSGLEAAVDWRAGGDVTLFASGGLLRTAYRDFVNGNGEDLDGREQAHAPRWSFALGAEWRRRAWYLRAEAEGRAAFHFSDSHAARSRAYALLHLRAGYETGDFDIALWLHNALDHDYHVRGFEFGNDPRIGYATRSYTQLGEPRHAGVTASLHF
jgi:outer membrane receptor protein involved in Fe transport